MLAFWSLVSPENFHQFDLFYARVLQHSTKPEEERRKERRRRMKEQRKRKNGPRNNRITTHDTENSKQK